MYPLHSGVPTTTKLSVTLGSHPHSQGKGMHGRRDCASGTGHGFVVKPGFKPCFESMRLEMLQVRPPTRPRTPDMPKCKSRISALWDSPAPPKFLIFITLKPDVFEHHYYQVWEHWSSMSLKTNTTQGRAGKTVDYINVSYMLLGDNKETLAEVIFEHQGARWGNQICKGSGLVIN